MTLGARTIPATGAMSLMKFEIEFVVEGRVDRVCRRDQEERVTVRICIHDRFGSDIGAGSWAVLDDEWLAEPLRQPLTHQARKEVGRTGRGRGNDYSHRPSRIGLRPGEAQRGREGASSRCEVQKLSAWKFHDDVQFSTLSPLGPPQCAKMIVMLAASWYSVNSQFF